MLATGTFQGFRIFHYTGHAKITKHITMRYQPKARVTQCDCVILRHRLRSYHSYTFKSYSYLSASGTSVRLRPSPLPGGKWHVTHLAYTGPSKQLKLLSIVYVECDLPDCTKAERSHRLAKQIRRSESETERDAWLSYCQKDFSTLGRRLWRTTSKRQSNTDIKFEYESMLSLSSYSL